jgi:hypothetical protein
MRVLFVSLVCGGGLLGSVGFANAEAIKLGDDMLDRITAAGTAAAVPSAVASAPNLDVETRSVTNSLTVEDSGSGSARTVAVVSSVVVEGSGASIVQDKETTSVMVKRSGSSLAGSKDVAASSKLVFGNGKTNLRLTAKRLSLLIARLGDFVAIKPKSLVGIRGMLVLSSIDNQR